jgi:protein phosphatase PTC2/3
VLDVILIRSLSYFWRLSLIFRFPITSYFSVVPGHGQGGELVSQYALHEVQRLLEKHPDFKVDIEKAFKETFLQVDDSLHEESLIEPMYAGTTACVALLRDKKLVLSNAGDSRAVVARRKKLDLQHPNLTEWEALDLTEDQNPDLPEEKARIEEMGGFVSPPPEPGLSARVWLDAECTQIGLAMARSIGDHAVKRIGVIAEPVVSFHDVQEEDEFLILATDGVWEFISSSEAVQIVADNLHKGATKACRALIEAAAARWHDEEGDYRDDITALVLRLQHLWSS